LYPSFFIVLFVCTLPAQSVEAIGARLAEKSKKAAAKLKPGE
jgi:hypothetical protein